MQSTLELLYRDAMENFNGTLHMLDADELRQYKECTEVLSRQSKELASVLGQERLEKYSSEQAVQDDFIQQAIFRRGLALGLRLGALAVL